ncbi:MAG: hypothetical protein Kow0029_14960 [Candidatus Rifleibacteriota bacterium]
MGFTEFNAPLGLYCLAELSPERISVVDLQMSYPGEEFFTHINRLNVRNVILRAGKNHDQVFLEDSIKILRTLFPVAGIGLSGSINKAFIGMADFFIYGTGHKPILNMLRGLPATGFINSMEEDLELELPIPEKAFSENYSYECQPEKIISRKTIEVFQPWLGLFEYSSKIEKYPGLKWISSFSRWIKDSGYFEIHFRPSGLQPEDLHELRSVMLNSEIQFAVGFKHFDETELEINCAGEPLKQVWLYEPEIGNFESFKTGLKNIAKAKCKPCLALNIKSTEIGQLEELLQISERLAILDMESWSLHCLKKNYLKFWGIGQRFFKRLFEIKTANELIGFLKTSAIILEVLFSKENAGGKR